MERAASAMLLLSNGASSWPQHLLLPVSAVFDSCAAAAGGCVLLWNHHVGALDEAAALQRPEHAAVHAAHHRRQLPAET